MSALTGVTVFLTIVIITMIGVGLYDLHRTIDARNAGGEGVDP